MNTNFPVQPTTFIGREEELTAITKSLINPGCRLLTLVGPGGAGKTRLATQAALDIARKFDRGAVFVNLQPVESADQMAVRIADSLNIPLSGQDEPRMQLFNYLGNKELLLVLDNFESRISETGFIPQLLQNAPAVKLLITSRQALNLQEEWLYPLSGMSYPDKKGLLEDESPDAVQFFVCCAQRIRPDFSFERERSAVIRICQLVDGLPLALEMAASWTKTLRCKNIAAEIQKDLEFLTSNLRNVSPQHRSMLAVFDQSWKYLDEQERVVFKRLSVFRGGFDLEAARAVTGAQLPILSGLVDKSIIWVEATGRYQIHELSRQYAKDKLEQTPEDAAQIQNRFSDYFIEFIHNREGNLIAGRQREATLEVKVELENIRKAWNWAISSGDLNAIAKSVMALSLFYQYQSRYIDGNHMLETAEAVLRKLPPSKKRDLILVAVLTDLAWLGMRLGKIDQVEQGLQESMDMLEKHKARPILGNCYDPRIPLGVIASIRGDSAETAKNAEQVLKVSQSLGEIWNEIDSYYLLTRASILDGDFEAAQNYAQQTYQLAKQNQEHWFMAYCLIELGNVATASGDYTAARGHFQASYQLREAFEDPEGMAVALNHLGDIARREAEYQKALAYFQESQKIYQEINDLGGLATSLYGLAQVALAQGNLVEAQYCFLAALQISSDIQYGPLITAILTGVARLLLQVGETQDVPRILSFLANNPASERETLQQVHKIARENKIAFASESTQLPDFEAYIAHLLVWLPTLKIDSIAKAEDITPSQPLIDPLTARELEVLQQIAAGLTNQQIAETLVISPGTAKWYTSQIYSKLGVRNRTQAVARARELEIIQL